MPSRDVTKITGTDLVTMAEMERRWPGLSSTRVGAWPSSRNEAGKIHYWYLRGHNGLSEDLPPEMRAEFIASGAELLYRAYVLAADLPDSEAATILLVTMLGHPAIERAFRSDPERWSRTQEALALTVREFILLRPFPGVGNALTPELESLLRFRRDATNLWPFDFTTVPDNDAGSPGPYFQLYYHALAFLREVPPHADTRRLMDLLEERSAALRRNYGKPTAPEPLEFLHDALVGLLSGKCGWHIPCPFEELLAGMLKHRYLKDHKKDKRRRRLQPLEPSDETVPDPRSDHSIATLERLYMKELEERLPLLLDALVRGGRAYVLPTLQGLLQILRDDGSILDLARRLGVTPRTIYNHLKTVQSVAKGLI